MDYFSEYQKLKEEHEQESDASYHYHEFLEGKLKEAQAEIEELKIDRDTYKARYDGLLLGLNVLLGKA